MVEKIGNESQTALNLYVQREHVDYQRRAWDRELKIFNIYLWEFCGSQGKVFRSNEQMVLCNYIIALNRLFSVTKRNTGGNDRC